MIHRNRINRRITRSLTSSYPKRIRKSPDRYEPPYLDNRSNGLIMCKKRIHDIECEIFYIGKTSTIKGMNKRLNQKYMKIGIYNIKELYRTSDQELSYEIERDLIKWAGANSTLNCLNDGLYKGGRAVNGPYIVYIAYQ